MTKLRTVAIAIIALCAGTVGAAGLLEISDESTILVSADESWEEPEQDIIHFRGSFEIRTPKWAVMADKATVFGKLDDLKRIVAEGTPVQFVFQDADKKDNPITRAEGQRLEYQSGAGLVSLTGSARLTQRDRQMRSSKIRYNLGKDKLEAGGPEGVRITTIASGQ